MLVSTAVAQIPEAETRISFVTETTRVDEWRSFITVEVRRAGDLSITSTVRCSTEDGTAVGGTHFTHGSGTLTFLPGVDSFVIRVSLLENSVPSEDLVFNLRLSDASAPTVIAPTSLHQVTLLDDDKPGRFRFALEASQWNETGGVAKVQIIRESGLMGPVSVNCRAISGTAVEGADFPATTGTVAFIEGQSSRVISIPIHNDPLLEANETFTIVLENPTGGATIGEPATHTVTVVSDDAPATLAFASRSSVVAESRPAAEVVVRRTGDPSQEVTVLVRSVDVEARENADHAPFSGMLTFGPNVTERTVTIPIVQDSLTEEPERFILVLSAPTNGAILGAEANHEVCIVSDDGPARISLMPGLTATTESAGSVAIRLVRSGNVSHWASVKLFSIEDSARAGDFATVNHLIHFATDDLIYDFSIAITDDVHVECTEKFVVALQAIEGDVALGENVRQTVEILDDEPTRFFFLTRYSTTREGGESVQVDVGRIGSIAATGTVVLSAEGISAAAGADFHFAPVELSFEPGSTQKSVEVSALADLEQEFGESFDLLLGPPNTGIARHHVTIIDPIPPEFVHGSYHGLVELYGFAEGAVSLKISARRELTGVLQMPWQTYRFKGRVDENGTFTRHFPAPGQPSLVAATLTLELSGDGSAVRGTVASAGTPFYSVVAKRDKASSTAAPVPEAGYYTAHLGGTAASPFGFLQIQVQPNGHSTITGMLPTNRRITASGRIAEDGTMGIYFANPIGDCLIGWSRFDPNEGMRLSGNLTGEVTLVLPDIVTGYTDSVTVAGARYRAVEKGRILDDFGAVNGEATMQVELEDADPLEIPFTWGPANMAFFARPNPSRPSLRFNPETGRWTGLFRHPNGREISIRGICVQNAGAGDDIAAGHYFGGYFSYGVRLIPRQP